MKTATRVFFLLLTVASIASAQRFDASTLTGIGLRSASATVSVDPASFGSPPMVMTPGPVMAPLAIDTLDDHFKRSTQFMIYSYRDQSGNTLPVIGSNGLYLFVGQKFPVSGSASVKGVLLAIAIARPAGGADTLAAYIFPGDPATGLPSGQPAGSGRFMTDGVDTSTSSRVFTYVDMEAPTDVTGPFVVMVLTRRGAATGDDLFVIWSNQHGDGKGQNRACFLVPNAQGQLQGGNLGAIIQTGGTPIDIDIMILPVVDGSISGTDRPAPSFDGLALLETYPQPSRGDFIARFRAERAMRVTLDIIDPSGRVIGQSLVQDLTSGINSVPVSLPRTALSAGRYFLRINGAGSSFATPILISGN